MFPDFLHCAIPKVAAVFGLWLGLWFAMSALNLTHPIVFILIGLPIALLPAVTVHECVERILERFL